MRHVSLDRSTAAAAAAAETKSKCKKFQKFTKNFKIKILKIYYTVFLCIGT